jgi:integrase/recombinase XerC
VKNSAVNVLGTIPVGEEVSPLLDAYLACHDFAPGTRRLVALDIRSFARWFVSRTNEPLTLTRITVRDVVDYRDHLRREKGQAVATVNRSLVLLRGFLAWLAEEGHIAANPARPVKELRKQPLAPKALSRSDVRKLLREVELRGDVRANALFSLMLFTGARVSDVVQLELSDLLLGERSGTVVFRHGKGNKQRSVPLPLPARRAIGAYLEGRPQVASPRVFVGERGPITERGIRNLCSKYGAICGIKLHPHKLRHTFATQFLADNQNDLTSLAQLMGHESISTTSRYVQRTEEQLAEATERVSY